MGARVLQTGDTVYPNILGAEEQGLSLLSHPFDRRNILAFRLKLLTSPKRLQMRHLVALTSLILGTGALLADPAGEVTDDGAAPPMFAAEPLSRLEERISLIDNELAQLAEYGLRTGVGSVGYFSSVHFEPASHEWIRIELEQARTVEQVVLVPSIWRDLKMGLRADGFPIEFQISVGTKEDGEGVLVASFGAEDSNLPRIAPLVISFAPTEVSWVEISATVLSSRLWDGLYVLQFSEIMIFSGLDNVALHQSVTTSSLQIDVTESRDPQFLVDGFVPYLMNSQHGERSVAFVSKMGIGDHPTLTVDLKNIVPLNRINLHAADLSDTIPQSLTDDFGIPRRWLVEGATRSDFSDAMRLNEYRLESIYDAGPIIMMSFPETTCRYVRLTALEAYNGHDKISSGTQIALAEIELFSAGKNVALGKDTEANFTTLSRIRTLSALTDGNNIYGKILPIREWMGQLARRHDLETERPIVFSQLTERYAHQKRNLKWMGWLVASLTGGIVIVILVDRIISLRHVAKIKERFAADLHDEIGANVHTIGLLSDAASHAYDSPEELKMLNTRIRQITERTGTAIRHCTDMLEAKDLYIGLVHDIRRTAQRNMAQFEHEIIIEGEEHIQRLKPRTRIDLFLFYKECLINICRHSGATKFGTRLIATPTHLSLTISDNGKGLSDLPEGPIPSSLSRRAHLLGARLGIDTIPNQGTSVTLKLRTKRFGFKK
jgi:signal transduction histidine kinase